ncbi:hypothetical protein M404DRAFT_35429 [Pisolithus tinctorius Marx 270]|uniref:Uncharacterized protein n=1 Tax=Pisolithus tinctorius Marx 270 TaxID=870435 RepID=A0A0C3J8M5_PISTI|nr:hypothetical protein M404DRAFT_35429 [Pisolithus tinctorius Marx 270]
MASILAFLYSTNENSGQQVVTFKRLRDDIEILVQNDVFPVNYTLSETNIYVNDFHFQILFDCHRHQHLHSQASYLFIRINHHGLPVHIWPKNDLHHILEALLMYFLILPFSVNFV